MSGTLIAASYESPIGALSLVLGGGMIHIAEFSDRPDRVARQLDRHYGGLRPENAELLAPVRRALDAYFSGETSAIDPLAACAAGTAFEQAVWRALRAIPAGTCLSYGALAAMLNSSPRAVGRANGRNPIAIIQPCHRLVGADGALTGYAGGLDRKAWLLKHEGARP
ncbi:MAG: methylated-DNA--[protein]-cysteine S-methyltransferase [Alphaproteobacteria bacterium]|nr:MAG: methylated-DNA--[protein]-cysteine S-methyltransferase [Alphaproteobacteria bacterium]